MASLGLDTNGSHLSGGGWCGVVLSALQVPKVVVSVNQSSGGGTSRAMGSNDECSTREPNTYRTQHHQHHHPALSRGVQSGEVDSTHLTAVRPQCRQKCASTLIRWSRVGGGHHRRVKNRVCRCGHPPASVRAFIVLTLPILMTKDVGLCSTSFTPTTAVDVRTSALRVAHVGSRYM